jgi:hypothetical protein
VTWAIIADVDLGSDSLRWMGPDLKVPITAVKCIIENKKYDAMIKYVTPKETIKGEDNVWNAYSVKSKDTYTKKDSFDESGPSLNYLNQFFSKDLNEKFKIEKVETVNDSLKKEEITVKEEMSDTPIIEMNEILKEIVHEEIKEEIKDAMAKEDLIFDPSKYEIVNEKEEVFNYTGFISQNVSNLSKDFSSFPEMHPSDGTVSLLFIKGGLPRMKMIKIMGEMEKGHYTIKDIERTQVVCYVLDPKSKGSFIAVDGEKVEYEKTLVEVHPSLMRIICPSHPPKQFQ